MHGNIQMVDLISQYNNIKDAIDEAILDVVRSGAYINGPQVQSFATALENYLQSEHVIPCANGTDALQIAMMALDLQPGDEVIIPAFTYVATAEVIALLGLRPIMTDVDPDTFNITAEVIEQAITEKTRAIVPVHLFGQSADMGPIMEIASKHHLYVVEDNAQAIGATYTFSNGVTKRTGTIGHIGTTSFFPSKNLGCFGDGGAIYTDDAILAGKIKMIANHGQSKKYYHDIVGVNSRLDTIQAAILQVKLQYLDQYIHSRRTAAAYYDNALAGINQITTPYQAFNPGHVFHQYTLKVPAKDRDALKASLEERGIPSMVYYPIPLYKQKAYSGNHYLDNDFPVTASLCKSVLSLPMHTELDEKQLEYICSAVRDYFKQYEA
jgi:UDP-2-acetamido-2-deoxy-ribo-hexuluronate aminotransferase